MQEKHVKTFRAAYDYWFDNKPINEVIQSVQPQVQEEPINESVEQEEVQEQVNEGFETHVLCSECGSGELELSKQKTKIRCKDCGNLGLTEGVISKLDEGKSMKLGGGGRFAKLKGKLESEGKSAESAGAIAASVGRKKYGAKKMGSMAAKGKKKASKNAMKGC